MSSVTLSPARVSERVCFRERHSRTAPSLLAPKEIWKKTWRNGSSEFSLLTIVTQKPRQCPFLVIGTCRTLKDTLNYFKFHAVNAAQEVLPPETGFSSSLVVTLCWFYPITLKALHWLPLLTDLTAPRNIPTTKNVNKHERARWDLFP